MQWFSELRQEWPRHLSRMWTPLLMRKQYIIVSAISIDGLCAKVNIYLNKNWELVGGVHSIQTNGASGQIEFYQAMMAYFNE
jgi:hypothetical protein